ncbi:SRC kinase signaling inhibitor 1, partial [Xenoophorus captivus]
LTGLLQRVLTRAPEVESPYFNTKTLKMTKELPSQLENQDSVLSLLRHTESELSLMMLDAMRPQEDPLQRQRLLVEEERLKYLNQEELLIQQLQ